MKTENGDPAAAAPGDSGSPVFSYADPKKPVQVVFSFKIALKSRIMLAMKRLKALVSSSGRPALRICVCFQLGVASEVQYTNDNPKGESCINKTIPQTYTRVSNYKKFINGIARLAKWC